MTSYVFLFAVFSVVVKPGLAQATTREHVGFSVFLGSGTSNIVNGTVMFNTIVFNDADAYCAETGHFKAPTEGVYLFSWWVAQDSAQEDVPAQLVVNGVGTVSALAQGKAGGQASQAGNTAVLAMRQGNEALIQTSDGGILDSQGRLCTFSGALLATGL